MWSEGAFFGGGVTPIGPYRVNMILLSREKKMKYPKRMGVQPGVRAEGI